MYCGAIPSIQAELISIRMEKASFGAPVRPYGAPVQRGANGDPSLRPFHRYV